MAALKGSEHLLYSTIRLTSQKSGVAVSHGTGFFWATKLDVTQSVVAIVTNKHVIAGATHVEALLHLNDGTAHSAPSGTFAPIIFPLHNRVIEHPDPEVDLCAILMSDLLNHGIQQGARFFIQHFSAENVPTDWENFDSIEEVIMIGCPRGLFDQVNNLPLVRRGISATPIAKRYNGRDEFMVDIACFPGSSGSPVLLFNRNGYVDPKTGAFHMGAARFFLLGVLYAGPQVTNQGEIVLSKAPTIQVSAMMHLGQVIRSSRLLELDAVIKSVVPFSS